MELKRTREKNLRRFGRFSLDGPLETAIEVLKCAKEDLEKSGYYDLALSSDGYDEWDLMLSGFRDETPAEAKAREEASKKRKKARAKAEITKKERQAALELKEYERLKAKFEGSKK